jgi:hypothetical protein
MQEDYIEQVHAVDGGFNGQPRVNMIPFPTRTIPDGEIIQTYAMGTHLNKAIKADSSIPMDFNSNRIIKRDNPLHSQTPMLWGCHPVMIFVR